MRGLSLRDASMGWGRAESKGLSAPYPKARANAVAHLDALSRMKQTKRKQANKEARSDASEKPFCNSTCAAHLSRPAQTPTKPPAASMQQQSTPATGKQCMRTISRQELEKAVGAIISRSSSLRQRMLRVKKAIEKEVDEVDQYSIEIEECLERIDEIEAFCKEVRRDQALAKHCVAAQMDIEGELQELLVEREEETQLLARMMQTREMHAEAHRKLMQHFAALHKEWLHVKKQQRALAMVLLRISLVRIARRKQII